MANHQISAKTGVSGLATAYLPIQEVKNNTVEIAILIGQYGKISLNNQSSLSDAYINALLSAVHSGDL